MEKVSDRKYKVVFNNSVGNVEANTLEQAIQAARAIVDYKLADVATIFRKINGKFKGIQWIYR